MLNSVGIPGALARFSGKSPGKILNVLIPAGRHFDGRYM